MAFFIFNIFLMANFKKLIGSFKNALKGLCLAIRYEQNFQIHLLISVFVLFLSFYFGLKVWEKVGLILVISSVLVLELINTIFERLSDILKPRIHHYIREIKDILAATVLIASIAAAIVGLLIFWPYMFK